ncbi:MAG: TIGR03619 family F420-dependent LLM class oxidoreductase [Alphaproteobacteria bacterium]|jgi:probable F420-dependent oxidoreductase|nr:TIGR03619 family F420-dependent LLM class oxidoreductase [Alphaproteobacteria bacterium]MDP6565318.1 TIGR03619 family F420-dependent LLM class oxidoreductase [Alphaproteobacteria bacterium]MDP6812049.1 TIGR03619 family F420-dependent LLM class oxidoreductase [Alphaproteobacteria bacterium]
MKVSVGFPTGMEGLTYPIPFSEPEALLAIARHAEALGYHSIWGNDHMTTQHYVREEFGRPPRFWEILLTYAWLASQTETLRFGTGILVLPMRRDIVVTAKQLITLDHLSGGRLELGVGVGAYREEFEALLPDDGRHRGNIVEEGVRALRVLFSEDRASFEGQFYRFRDVELFPKPLQDKLPVYFGGNNVNQLRRTAKLGDGWLPAGLPLGRIAADIVQLRELCDGEGRDFAEIEVAPQYIALVDHDHDRAVERFSRSQMHKHLVSLTRSTLKEQAGISMVDANLVGTPAEVVDKALALKAAGVGHLLGLYFAVNTVEELLDQMTLFAEEVVPHLS